ncbi:MAG: hypothetical protein ACTS3F_14100 [Phycisphaerales bacterium]
MQGRMARWGCVAAVAVMGAALASGVIGCQSISTRPSAGTPRVLVSPYPGTPVTVAVAPPINESGFSRVDVLRVADALVNQVQEVPGLMALPTNRTLSAMESLEMPEVRTPSDARNLARALGADIIIVASITSWEPYEPFEMGFNAAVFAVTERALASAPNVLDPRTIRSASSDVTMTYRPETSGPDAIASVHLNAADADVQALAARYAQGRHDPNSALGSVRYLKAMRHYTQFASYHLVDLLLEAERRRIAGRTSFAGVSVR